MHARESRSDVDEEVREVDGTTYVHGAKLADWLRESHRPLSPGVLDQVRPLLQQIEERKALAAAASRSAPLVAAE